MEKSTELSIIVYSCMKNRDMWEVFTQFFNRYWEDCLYKVILVTDVCDTKQLFFDEVVVFDGTWYEMIQHAIEKANTPYVMLWMDDYLICDKIENDKIQIFLNLVQKYHAGNMQLHESTIIRSKPFDKDQELGCYKQGTGYSLSTQVGIWDVSFLKKAMHKEWSAWDFERKGSLEIVDESYCLLVTKKYSFPYVEGVRRGKWMPHGIQLCKTNDIILDLKARPAMSKIEWILINIKGIILRLNPTLVLKLQNLLQKENL